MDVHERGDGLVTPADALGKRGQHRAQVLVVKTQGAVGVILEAEAEFRSPVKLDDVLMMSEDGEDVLFALESSDGVFVVLIAEFEDPGGIRGEESNTPMKSRVKDMAHNRRFFHMYDRTDHRLLVSHN